MEGLKNKKILLIAPSFFNYDIEIKNKLEELGAEVSLFDDRPSNNSIVKGIIRINRSLIGFFINRYYKRIIADCKNKNFDLIFFTKGESLTRSSFSLLKMRFPKAKFVLYLWDSIKNNNNKDIFNKFDKVLSFDKQDCKDNSHFKFRPLFYLDQYKGIAQKVHKLDYDLSFVGTIHSDRYKILKAIEEECSKVGYSNKFVFFMPSVMLYWFRRFFDSKNMYAKRTEINFKSISFREVTSIFERSKAILDIQHPYQTGLTMRSIEVIGAKKKFITTNSDIKNYDFYNENNILIINRDNPLIPPDFMNSEYIDLSKEIYDKYSINGWIDDCLG